MFENSRRNLTLMGGAIGVVLALAVGVAAGVVPQAVDSVTLASEEAAVLGPEGSQGGGDAAAPSDAAVEAAVETTEAPAPSTTEAPSTTTATRWSAPALEPEPAPEPVTQAAAPSAPTPTVPTRVNPSSAQVMQALQVIQQRVPMFRLNEAQARQFGNSVCDAFDQGMSLADVKAGILQALSQVPLVVISVADIDYAVRTSVALFCPVHSSKL